MGKYGELEGDFQGRWASLNGVVSSGILSYKHLEP